MTLVIRRTSAAVAALATLALSSPLLAATITQQRAVSGFHGVGLAVPARMEIVQGATEGLTLSGDEQVLAQVETAVENGVLQIRFPKGREMRSSTRLRITLNVKSLESIAIAGSGDVSAPALQSKDLVVKVAGSGDVEIGGRAESLQVSISGSGDLKASRFDTQRTRISIAGSGDATVWARQALDVRVAGSGDVRYYGDPTVARKVAGSGSVRRAGASPG